ncbi:MAG: hypothetical protein Q9227_008243 [Pyrenula ochraceoflavens]
MSEQRPPLTRNFSAAVRHAARATHIRRPLAKRKRKNDLERRRLINDYSSGSDSSGASTADSDGLFPPRTGWTDEDPHPPNPHQALPVYRTIFMIRRDVICSIDDPYSLEQLKAPRINLAIVRPLVDRLYNLHDVSVVYCLLVNRMQFLREQSYKAHHQTVNLTRALLCELAAEKILRRFNEHNPGPKGLLLLANILVAGFEPFQNAPLEVIQENSHAMHWAIQNRGGYERKLTSLEVAIISQSKSFLSNTACQKVVDAIYKGRLVYTPNSFIDIIPDHYKHKPISLYQPARAPLLNQYRLIVPRTRNFLEVVQFVILLILYVLTMIHRGDNVRDHEIHITGYEVVFMVYAFGWVLDQTASMLEHGWKVYTQNLWSFLDVIFSSIYLVYFCLRLHAFAVHNHQLSHQALDLLSCAAPVLIPRLAFNLMSENMLFVSLRAMMSDFLTLTLLAVWCFVGFLLSMKWLNYDAEYPHKSITLGKWMLWVWFGLDGTGIQRSIELHRYLGPVLMVAFAFLGNTLFLTILVSMLTNTFSNIVRNATAEIQFRRAVLTFEGVKSDAIFAYQPPFNILALGILLPLKFIVNPRWFHKINVFCVRFINAPLLLAISVIERQTLWNSASSSLAYRLRDMIEHTHIGAVTPRGTRLRFGSQGTLYDFNWLARLRRRLAFWTFSRFSIHGDIQAVFDTEPPQSVLDEIEDMDEWNGRERLNRPLSVSQFDSGDGLSPQDRRSSMTGNIGGLPSTEENGGPTRPANPQRASTHSSDHLIWAENLRDPTDYRRAAMRKDSNLSLGTGADAQLEEMVHESTQRMERLEKGFRRLENLLTRVLNEDDGSQNESAGNSSSSDAKGEDAPLNESVELENQIE